MEKQSTVESLGVLLSPPGCRQLDFESRLIGFTIELCLFYFLLKVINLQLPSPKDGLSDSGTPPTSGERQARAQQLSDEQKKAIEEMQKPSDMPYPVTWL